MKISSPGIKRPFTRCDSRIFCVIDFPIFNSSLSSLRFSADLPGWFRFLPFQDIIVLFLREMEIINNDIPFVNALYTRCLPTNRIWHMAGIKNWRHSGSCTKNCLRAEKRDIVACAQFSGSCPLSREESKKSCPIGYCSANPESEGRGRKLL